MKKLEGIEIASIIAGVLLVALVFGLCWWMI